MEKELKDRMARSKWALADPEKVVKIAVAALGSPTRAYNVVRESVGDKQLAEDWSNLLGLKRDQEKLGIDFEEVLSSLLPWWKEEESLTKNQKSKQEEKEMGEKTKDLSEMGFRIPSGVVIKSVVGRPHDTFLTFPNEEDIFDLCGWLLRGIDEAGLWEKKYPKRVIPDHNPPRFTLPTVNEALIEEFIRVLEERRGLKVKICGSCKHMVIMTISGPTCVLKTGKDTGNTVHEIDVCDINSWDPKEAPKGEVKLESAPTVKELQEKSTRGAVEIHASKK